MRRERVLLLLLATAQFTNIMDFMIVMPLVDMLSEAFTITPQQFSLIVASYTLSAGTSSFFGTFFLDRFDR
ncbi:MAG: MFS transporter, partial [Bacteroidota bacterium]